MEELFDYIFRIYKKFGGNNPSIFTPTDCNIGWVTRELKNYGTWKDIKMLESAAIKTEFSSYNQL